MRILIIKLSSIGDVVHALPAAALLRRSLPEAHICWIADRRASEILIGSPAINELLEIDARAWRRRPASRATLRAIRKALLDLKDRKFDVAIDFQGLIKSGLIALASGAARRIGFESEDLREPLSRIFLNCQVATSHIRHVIDKNLALAAAAAGLNRPEGEYQFPISIAPADEQFAEEATNGYGRFAIINPGGGWPTKLWPPERYGQLADWLWREYQMASLVTYGPGEEALANAVVESSKSGAARAIRSTLKQFVALTRRAALFVGGDTGPLHLAAASGTPLVGLYGPTRPERNGPFNARDIALGRDLWCRTHCYRRSCWHWECMEIPISQVQRAISERLKYG